LKSVCEWTSFLELRIFEDKFREYAYCKGFKVAEVRVRNPEGLISLLFL